MLGGREFEYGSVKETMAILVQQKLNEIRMAEHTLLIKAMTTVANTVINPKETKFDDLNKSMSKYRELMFPIIALDRENASKKLKKIMRSERDKVLKIILPPGFKSDRGRLSKRTV